MSERSTPPAPLIGLRKRTLSSKRLKAVLVAFLTTVVVALSLAHLMTATNVLEQSIDSVRVDLERKAREEPTELLRRIETGILMPDEATLRQQINDVVRDADIRYVLVTDAEGRALAAAGRSSLSPAKLFRGPDGVVHQTPEAFYSCSTAELAGTVVGHAVFVVSKDRLAASDRMRRHLLVVALVAGAIAVVMGLLFVGFYLGPLITLTEDTMIELARSTERALEASRLKSVFLSNMSHELRTPLHGILSFAQFGLREHQTAKREELRDYFQHVHESGGTLLALLNDLLDLAKLEAGRMNYQWQECDLADLAAEVSDEWSAVCWTRGVKLGLVGFENGAPVTADPMRMKQVLRNVLGNAMRFTKRWITLELQSDSAGGWHRVRVVDDGPGIPADELASIFDKFTQSSKTASGAGGTGLGLAICREIVDAHRGRIWAENGSVEGAMFVIELPGRGVSKLEPVRETPEAAA